MERNNRQRILIAATAVLASLLVPMSARAPHATPTTPPTSTPGSAAEVLSAPDLDKDDPESNREVLIAWVNHYDRTSRSGTQRDDCARAFRNALRAKGWADQEDSEGSVWEEEWKRAAAGGREDSIIDQYDLAYFAGHGSMQSDERTIFFANNDHDDAHLHPGDAYRCWGDNDLEWVCVQANALLASISRNKWAQAMKGLHLILGWGSDKKDCNMGWYLGKGLIKDNPSDAAMRIVDAWFDAADRSHGYGYIAYAVGETQAMGNDYIWGQGYVNPDPTWDSAYYTWSHVTRTVGAMAATPSAAAARRVDWVVVDPANPASGLVVRYDPAITYAGAAPPYSVVAATIDTFAVRSVANLLNDLLGGTRMQGGDIDSVTAGEFCLGVGADLLRVSPATGAVNFIDTANWMDVEAVPASLPSEGEAHTAAAAALSALGLLPPAGQWTWGATQWLEAAERDTFDTVLSSRDLHIRVGLLRQLGGLPVHGPGASISVDLGEGSSLQRLSVGGWRAVGPPGTPLPMLALADLAAALADYGSYRTLDGFGAPVDTLDITAVEVGYYEEDSRTAQASIEPVLIVTADLHYGGTITDVGLVFHVALTSPVSVADVPAHRPVLLQTWPNPFNARLQVAYDVSEGGPLVIAVYDTRGRHVATLLDETVQPGRGELTWNGRDAAGKAVASGAYVVRADGAGGQSVRRVTLVQ